MTKDHSSKMYGYWILFILLIGASIASNAQNLYTARGYWEESNKPAYRTIKDKQAKNEALSADEEAYLQDFENYLQAFFNRLSPEEKQRYAQMKEQWDRETAMPSALPGQQQTSEQAEFEWRGRDRFLNGLYGAYYGTSLVLITEMDNAAAAGIPIITAGAWLLGPALNPKKYEGITQTTVNASNTGKFLGVVNGWSLALAVSGESESLDKIGLGLSTIGSIAMGEIGFQLQKKKNIGAGRVEMFGHYGLLGPLVGASVLAATNTDNANLVGVGLLAGSAAGLILANKASNRYDYTQGDVNMLSSLSGISAGLGFAAVGEILSNSTYSDAIFLVPASTAVIGSLVGQRQVKNVYLTKRQGSTIVLSSVGAGLVGFGVAAMLESESSLVIIGVPSALALITHQLVFNKYKNQNLVNGLKGFNRHGKKVDFAMKLMPENYLINKHMPMRTSSYNPALPLANPLVNISLKFR
ncbi:MAG: hypothetical protein MUF39_03085 [Cyclobacteriaceae bacterium]|jgi:hypothetical protein|nr:hypothetical protein [Cyclobacteriaceae bacterium]